MNFIFGTAGFAKEVDWLTEEIYRAHGGDFRTDFFVAEDGNTLVGSTVSSRTVLSESEYFERFSGEATNIFVAVGSPNLKNKIVSAVKERAPLASFPNLIDPGVRLDDRPGRVKIGKGNIICAGTVLTTDIELADFVHLNLLTTVGHDCRIGDFSTISPGVNISGNVRLGARVFFGTGAVILERISVCDDAVIGANATVNREIAAPGTYVGSPARKIK